MFHVKHPPVQVPPPVARALFDELVHLRVDDLNSQPFCQAPKRAAPRLPPIRASTPLELPRTPITTRARPVGVPNKLERARRLL